MADYLRIPVKTLLEMPTSAYFTFRAVNQPPFLQPESVKTNGVSTFSKFRALKQPPNTYYGIGGNSLQYRLFIPVIGLNRYREKVLEDTGRSPSTIIYDAFSYDILNRMNSNNERPTEIWNEFLYAIDREADTIERMNNRRRKIFQKMGWYLKGRIDYVPATSLFKDPEYVSILSKLLEEPKRSWSELVPMSYRDRKESQLYIPMELAEALTLRKKYGVELKTGDFKEKCFDIEISKIDPTILFAYTPSATTQKGMKPPYRNNDDISFDMTPEDSKAFLESQPSSVKDQFGWILQELGKDPSNLVDETLSVFSEIQGEIDE